MGFRRVVGAVSFFIVAGVVLAIVLTGPTAIFNQTHATAQQAMSLPTGNAIARENSYPGTTNWKITPGRASTIQIQAYANLTSVIAGQKLTFYVSTHINGTSYAMAIYRLGWYGGLGGRLITYQGNLIGEEQGYYDTTKNTLVSCSSCHIDTATGLVEANWNPSYSLVVPTDWTTGVYLAKFTDARGLETYVPFDIAGNQHSSYIVVTADTTYAAYNVWGGYSLYSAQGSIDPGENNNLKRAAKVSFDRPYADGQGASQLLPLEADAIHWLESQNYDLSYISSVDLQKNPSQLLDHRAYISLGHDEYWTKEMRDGVEHARNSGVGLAFLEADAGYWQMRFEPDSAGVLDRTVVCYKVQTANNDLLRDPLYGIDNSRLTSMWRDPVVGRPENALIGIMYSSLIHSRKGYPWKLDPHAHTSLLNNTGLQKGQQYGCDIVGYEWDRIYNNGYTPANLQLIATSDTISLYNNADFSNTTYYIAPSRAMVFATGSIYWAASLDSYRSTPDPICTTQDISVPGIQKLMSNIMDALVVHHTSNTI